MDGEKITMEINTEKIKTTYEKYWDCDEINIDLANQLVSYIPKLLSKIKLLQDELGESREHEFSFEHLWFDQKKENEQLHSEISQLRKENERLECELARNNFHSN